MTQGEALPTAAPEVGFAVDECAAVEEHGCTTALVAILDVACAEAPTARLVCAAAVEYVRRCHIEDLLCGRCGEPTRDCWKVVVLP